MIRSVQKNIWRLLFTKIPIYFNRTSFSLSLVNTNGQYRYNPLSAERKKYTILCCWTDNCVPDKETFFEGVEARSLFMAINKGIAWNKVGNIAKVFLGLAGGVVGGVVGLQLYYRKEYQFNQIVQKLLKQTTSHPTDYQTPKKIIESELIPLINGHNVVDKNTYTDVDQFIKNCVALFANKEEARTEFRNYWKGVFMKCYYPTEFKFNEIAQKLLKQTTSHPTDYQTQKKIIESELIPLINGRNVVDNNTYTDVDQFISDCVFLFQDREEARTEFRNYFRWVFMNCYYPKENKFNEIVQKLVEISQLDPTDYQTPKKIIETELVTLINGHNFVDENTYTEVEQFISNCVLLFKYQREDLSTTYKTFLKNLFVQCFEEVYVSVECNLFMTIGKKYTKEELADSFKKGSLRYHPDKKPKEENDWAWSHQFKKMENCYRVASKLFKTGTKTIRFEKGRLIYEMFSAEELKQQDKQKRDEEEIEAIRKKKREEIIEKQKNETEKEKEERLLRQEKEQEEEEHKIKTKREEEEEKSKTEKRLKKIKEDSELILDDLSELD